MKKLVTLLACNMLILITIYAAFILFGHRLDSSSKVFVDTNMLKFFSTFSEEELLNVSTVELRHNMSSDPGVNHLFSKLKQLGQFQNYEGSKGEANIGYNFKSG